MLALVTPRCLDTLQPELQAAALTHLCPPRRCSGKELRLLLP